MLLVILGVLSIICLLVLLFACRVSGYLSELEEYEEISLKIEDNK